MIQKINERTYLKKDDLRLKQVAFFSFVIFCIVMVAFTTYLVPLDSDGYFILAEGGKIVTKGISYENSFFIDSGYKTVVQQWLWCLVSWWTFDHWGNLGIRIFSLILLLADCGVVYSICRDKRCNSWYSGILTVIFSFFMILFVNIRPTLVTVLILLLEIKALEQYRHNRSKMTLLFLPFLSLAMINIHASMWPMLFVFVLPYIFPPILTKIFPIEKEYSFKECIPIVIATVSMIPVGFLNPYGIEGMLYLVNSYNSNLKSLGIIELTSPSLLSFSGLCTLASIVIVSFYVSAKKEVNKKIDRPLAYLYAGCFFMVAMHLKNMSFLGLATPLFFASLFADKDTRTIAKMKSKKLALIVAMIMEVLCIGIIGLSSNITLRDEIKEGDSTPVEAVQYLNNLNIEEKDNLRIYTNFNTGAYLEYSGYKVFFDARPELYFKSVNKKADVIKDYQQMNATEKGYKSIVDKYKFNYLIVYTNSNLDTYLSYDENATLITSNDIHRMYKYTNEKGAQKKVEYV